MSTHGSGSNQYTRGIADFVTGLRYEDVPADVIARIKLLMLDSLGCALYGAELPWSRILMETLAETDTSTGAGVWGTNRRLSAPNAALVNGTLVQSFELDDVHRVGVLHVGAVTLPALFAVAEMRPGMSGRELLAAAVAGYEIGPRVGMCMGQEHIGQGWHSGATVGVFSAVAGAARALRLMPEQAVHATGSMARCSPSVASPASSTCSRTRMAVSAPPSRARPTASTSQNSPRASASAGRPRGSR